MDQVPDARNSATSLRKSASKSFVTVVSGERFKTIQVNDCEADATPSETVTVAACVPELTTAEIESLLTRNDWRSAFSIAFDWGLVFASLALVAALMRPSPAAIVPGTAEIGGAYHITRHPLFMAVGSYGLLHLLVARVNATELAFFAGFPLFAWAGCRHQDRRKLATGDEKFRRFHDETVFFPFTGSGALRGLREIRLPLAIGTGLAIALRVFHPRLFG